MYQFQAKGRGKSDAPAGMSTHGWNLALARSIGVVEEEETEERKTGSGKMMEGRKVSICRIVDVKDDKRSC